MVARWQLLQAGLTDDQVKLRLAAGRLTEVHRGVYLVGAVAPGHAHEMAALLACASRPSRAKRRSNRPTATPVLSHRSAAALWQLLPYPATAPVCVTVQPGRSTTRGAGGRSTTRGGGRSTTPGGTAWPLERSTTRSRLALHRAHVTARDLRRLFGMPLTSPPRTILDLAARLDVAELERVIAEAGYRRLASEAELLDQLHRNGGKRGIATLRRVLDLPGGPRRTRSPAERLMVRLLREAGVDGYETNARIHGYEVDLLWRDRGFAVEIDGYDAHSGRVAFERDRLKVATLRARGVGVMPVTGRQLRDDPAGALRRLLSALELAARAATETGPRPPGGAVRRRPGRPRG